MEYGRCAQQPAISKGGGQYERRSIMRILILGAGAIGGYFGARLIEAGADVSFLVRPGRKETLLRSGLRINSPLGNFDRQVRALTAQELRGPYEGVILACKAYDLGAAAAAVAPAMGPKSELLPLLNGYSHLEKLDELFGANRVLGGLAHLQVRLCDDGAIEHMSPLNAITFGSRNTVSSPLCEKLGRRFAATPVQATQTQDIELAMWEKWVFLATFAGMTCLMRGNVGEIVATRDGKAFCLSLLDECARIALACGGPCRESSMDEARRFLTTKGSPATSSMYRDVQRGARTESDHILRDLYLRAVAKGTVAPMLRIAVCNLEMHEQRLRSNKDSAETSA